MTTTLHSAIPLGQIHSPVNWIFTTAAARRAQSGLTSAHLGCQALQTDTTPATLWYVSAVSGGTATWRQVTDASDGSVFSGDFAAVAATYSLTVRGFWRSDLGVSGTTGTGVTTWVNQSGSASSVTGGTAATNGIATPGTGLNGKASLIADGATQWGVMTMPVQAAPATTPRHKWWIGRQISNNVSGAYHALFSGQDGASEIVQNYPTCELRQYQGSGGATTSGLTLNQWCRGRASFTGSSSDVLRVGSVTATGTTAGNSAPTQTGRSVFGEYGGVTKVNYELLAYLEIEGTLANFLLFDADAGPKAQSFWTSAIAI